MAEILMKNLEGNFVIFANLKSISVELEKTFLWNYEALKKVMLLYVKRHVVFSLIKILF